MSFHRLPEDVDLPDMAQAHQLTSCSLGLQVMIDHELRKLRLIDWGLAEFYHPSKE